MVSIEDIMKRAKQIRVNNHTKTVINCSDCGATTSDNAGIHTKTARTAIQRPCSDCNLIHNHLCGQGWWIQFGLKKNPYVYGPMPRLRTSRDYKMQEGRRTGWMAWTWDDEYKEERKRTTTITAKE